MKLLYFAIYWLTIPVTAPLRIFGWKDPRERAIERANYQTVLNGGYVAGISHKEAERRIGKLT